MSQCDSLALHSAWLNCFIPVITYYLLLFTQLLLSSFQVYAPISGQDRSFHRTLFVFCCKTRECYTCNDSRCVKGHHYCCFSVFCHRREYRTPLLKSSFQSLHYFISPFSPHPLWQIVFSLPVLPVFRSQIPRRNEFYPFSPPSGLCILPGCRSNITIHHLILLSAAQVKQNLVESHHLSVCLDVKELI